MQDARRAKQDAYRSPTTLPLYNLITGGWSAIGDEEFYTLGWYPGLAHPRYQNIARWTLK